MNKKPSGIIPRVPKEQQFNPLQVTFAQPKRSDGYLKVSLPQDIVDELKLKAETAKKNESRSLDFRLILDSTTLQY